ncbi:hypothetical protein P7K49_018735 [Saguinus oedipus]|uniref:Uncharacterized protein n=1 Tax=Saguinus oedipus TaxID=9490 RepID=A0ABQ9V685_SAGOE|nr:hypothetical protein P7K49_018735 [Saguinus oedipus]
MRPCLAKGSSAECKIHVIEQFPGPGPLLSLGSEPPAPATVATPNSQALRAAALLTPLSHLPLPLDESPPSPKGLASLPNLLHQLTGCLLQAAPFTILAQAGSAFPKPLVTDSPICSPSVVFLPMDPGTEHRAPPCSPD